MNAFPCTIMRAGTSKGLFFKVEDMPKNKDDWEAFLLDAMGSPDANQIDGLGGANSLTSKVAIIGTSSNEDADVDYTFAQVSLTDAKVDMKGNCGNISSGAGPFAVNAGLIDVKDGRTQVRVYNTNTKKTIVSYFEVKDGRAVTEGDLEIPGVPGSAAPVEVVFGNPEGAVTGKLLPTDNAVDMIETSFGTLPVSIVDAANPLVYMNAKDLGFRGNELPSEYTDEMLAKIEEVRSIAAEMCGFCKKEEATKESPAVPKSTILSAPSAYSDIKGKAYTADQYDLSIRMMSMQKPHKALAITGAVCTTRASNLEGTLVHSLTKDVTGDLRLGHPGGLMQTKYYSDDNGTGVAVLRTARPIMKGEVYTKKSY